MKRTFLATLLAAALALGGVAASANRAHAGDDYAKVIIGATALAIIGTAIASSHHNRDGYRHKPYASRHGYSARHGGYYKPYKPYKRSRHAYGHRKSYGHGYRGHAGYGGHSGYGYR